MALTSDTFLNLVAYDNVIFQQVLMLSCESFTFYYKWTNKFLNLKVIFAQKIMKMIVDYLVVN